MTKLILEVEKNRKGVIYIYCEQINNYGEGKTFAEATRDLIKSVKMYQKALSTGHRTADAIAMNTLLKKVIKEMGW